jgi:hypothetical protein
MGRPDTLDARIRDAKRRGFARSFVATALLTAAALGAPQPAQAQRGCLVLLCLAAPNWRAIPQCVEPIRQLLRDLARGRPFPTCPMSGSGNTANHQWATAPGNCPPQYTQVYEGDSSRTYACDYAGAVSVTIDGALWSRTWWGGLRETVTEFMPAAKTRLRTWDTRFDDEYAAWLGLQPLAPPTCEGC